MAHIAIDYDKEKLRDFCRKWKITEFSLFGSVVRDDEEFVIPIREYAPLCLGEGLRWGKAIEVGRGSAPERI